MVIRGHRNFHILPLSFEHFLKSVGGFHSITECLYNQNITCRNPKSREHA